MDYFSYSRYIFQLHHDDGGQQRGADRGGPQLPPPDSRDPRHASLGKSTSQNKVQVFTILSPGQERLLAVAPLAPQNEQTEEEDISENHSDEQQDEGP